MKRGSFKLMATQVGVAGLAGCGFTLSFASLRELAIGSGVLPSLAFLWPLSVDGFIVMATVAAIRLKGQGPRVVWYPWAALVLFAAISIAGNAIHAAESATRSLSVGIATTVSAVPAIALLIASHLLVVMAEHGRGDARPADPRPTPPTAHVGELTVSEGPTGLDTAQEPAATQAEEHPAPTVRQAAPVEKDSSTGTIAQEDGFLTWLREQRGAGVSVTSRLAAEHLGVSDRTARRRLSEARAAHPDLFDSADQVAAR